MAELQKLLDPGPAAPNAHVCSSFQASNLCFRLYNLQGGPSILLFRFSLKDRAYFRSSLIPTLRNPTASGKAEKLCPTQWQGASVVPRPWSLTNPLVRG